MSQNHLHAGTETRHESVRVSRKASPVVFAAILAAFALPFGTVSCEGPPVKFTGYELATWRVQQTSPPAATDDGGSLPEAIEREGSAMAFLMLASAVVGLALGLAGRRGAGFAVATGLVATAALWSKVFDLDSGAEHESGFELATCMYLVLAVWHAALAIRRRRFEPRHRATVLPPGARPWGHQ